MRKIFNLFVFFLFSLCASTTWGQTASVPPPPPSCNLVTQKQVLIDFYNATGGDNWNIPVANSANKWKQGGVFTATINNWYGVKTNTAGCVIGIDLDGEVDFGWAGGNEDNFRSHDGGNNLGGTANQAITKLSALKELTFLSLCKNPFTPSIIPTDLSTLPSLTKLQHLQLTDCKLTGQIPLFIGSNLTQLVSLSFENNNLLRNTNALIPSIPTNFSNLLQLRYLYINTNPNLGIGTGPNDELPLNLSNTLRVLSLAGSNLFGKIPTTWNFPNMTELILNNNKLLGPIPSSIGNMTNLTWLLLGGNELTGSIIGGTNIGIPSTFSNLTRLEYFGVQNNKLSGRVSLFATNATFHELRIEDNSFNFGDIEPSNIYTNAIANKPKTRYEPQAPISITFNNGVLSVNPGGTLPAEVFRWFKDNVLVATVPGNNTYRPTQCGTYRCEVSHNGNVTIPAITRPIPPPPTDLQTNLILVSYDKYVSLITATATSNSPVCAGASLNLSSSGGASYAWAGPNTFTSTLQNPVRAGATAAMAGVYTVTVKNATGCSATATTSVVVNAKPTLLADTPRPICRGTSTTLTASSSGNTIKWIDCTTGAVLATGGSFTTPALAVSTNYCVVATSPQGCISDKVQVAVTVKECCAEVKYDVKCGAKLGTYDVYFSFTNLSGQVIDRVRPVISTSGVTASVPFINMSPLVQTGATSATYSFTISGATAGQKLCMSLMLQKECDFKCQTPEFCIEVPACIEPVACNLDYGIACIETGLYIKFQATNPSVSSIVFQFNDAIFSNGGTLNTFNGQGDWANILLNPSFVLPAKICGIVYMYDKDKKLICKQDYCFELPYCKVCQFDAGIEGVKGDVKYEVTNAPERTNLTVYGCGIKEFTMFVYGSYSNIVPVLPLPAGILYVTPNLSSQSVLIGLDNTLITVPTVFRLLISSKDGKCSKVLMVTVLPCSKAGRVGLNEPVTTEDTNSYITVFPNPVQDEEITVELKDSDWTKAQLVDSNGITLNSVQRNGESNQFKMKISLSTGTYFIRVESSNGIFTKTVVR